MQISFDTDVKSKQDVEKYKGTDGRSDRVGCLADGPFVEWVHYKEFPKDMGGKGYWKCVSERSADGKIVKRSGCCDACGDADPRFGIALVQYATKADGDFKKPLSWEVKAWLFNFPKYESLKRIRKTWGSLVERDLLITCPEGGEEFQKLTIEHLPEAVWTKSADLKKEVLEAAEAINAALPGMLARNCSEDEWKRKLGVATADAVPAGGPAGTGKKVHDIDALLNSDD